MSWIFRSRTLDQKRTPHLAALTTNICKFCFVRSFFRFFLFRREFLLVALSFRFFSLRRRSLHQETTSSRLGENIERGSSCLLFHFDRSLWGLACLLGRNFGRCSLFLRRRRLRHGYFWLFFLNVNFALVHGSFVFVVVLAPTCFRGHSMIMTTAKISFCDWGHAVSAVTKFDSSVSTSKVRAHEVFSVFCVFGDYEVGGLEVMVHRHAPCATGNNDRTWCLTQLIL
mmetsp:Transcript_99628/g.149191  ORF Transcript_99628/g.149191 Transcript_99628/m.149191 type:complete len:227 (+) Transcript_99628:558-1238(+)